MVRNRPIKINVPKDDNFWFVPHRAALLSDFGSLQFDTLSISPNRHPEFALENLRHQLKRQSHHIAVATTNALDQHTPRP